MSLDKPGQGELAKKVFTAFNCVKTGNLWVAVDAHYGRDCAALYIDSEAEFRDFVLKSLDEIKAGPPHKVYAGHRPSPEVAGEPKIKGEKFWAFCWESTSWAEKMKREEPGVSWERQMYLKFALEVDK